jgi:hypothetical protein
MISGKPSLSGTQKGLSLTVLFSQRLSVCQIVSLSCLPGPMFISSARHREIYEPYGTMADFDELLKTMHEHGLKLIMDLVVNHCSSEVGVSRSCLL